jgi:hypothetical protein
MDTGGATRMKHIDITMNYLECDRTTAVETLAALATDIEDIARQYVDGTTAELVAWNAANCELLYEWMEAYGWRRDYLIIISSLNNTMQEAEKHNL